MWTEHFAPGVPAETIPLPLLKSGQVTASGGRGFTKAASFGWGGLALAALIGALSSGFSGAAVMSGLFALVVGVIALARGRVGWAQLGSRAAGGLALGAAVVLITGALAASSSTPPGIESTTTSSDTPTTTDAAAEAAAQAAAAETAAAEVAATEAAAAVEKAAAEASAQATADAAAAQATADAAAAKATADAAAAQALADAAAAKKAQAAAMASAKAEAAAAAAAAAPRPAPPAASVYYENCTAARAAGVTPIYRGQPGYASKLDRDGDGIACE